MPKAPILIFLLTKSLSLAEAKTESGVVQFIMPPKLFRGLKLDKSADLY